jgi:transketolase
MTTLAAALPTMRDRFVAVTQELLDADERVGLLLADISASRFEQTARRHPHRVVNVGIREQLLIGAAAGMAAAGLRPIAHSYAPFLVERPFEQLKVDLGHQALGAILVSIGASYDAAAEGRTHQAPGDVALLSTLPGWTVHVPGHADETERAIRQAAAEDGCVYVRLAERTNRAAPAGAVGGLVRLREGTGGVVLTVGPMLDPVLAATEGLDVTVLYTATPAPLNEAGLRAAPGTHAVVLVEPYLAGTSAAAVSRALVDVPHRLLALGVPVREHRRYGTAAEHDAAHGLDATGLRERIRAFV